MYWVILALIALLALWLLYKEKILTGPVAWVIAVLLVGAAFYIRALCRDYISGDYYSFLRHWVEYFRESGGFAGLKDSVGNYNLLYLYFLAVFSYFPMDDLYLIKLLSIFFDVILAWYSLRLVGLMTKSSAAKMAVFFLVLFLPTVILNGAYWGQCDVIYTAFGVMGIFYALDNKPVRGVACIAISFAFKLQAVFIIPVFFVFLLTGKVRIRHLFVFPIVYAATILPAVIAGRSFMESLLFYFNYADSAGTGLNYNSASIFAFAARDWNAALAAKLGIAAAALLILAVYAMLIARRRRIGNGTTLLVAAIFTVGIPLLLPHMHDRYFFPADVITLICAVVCAQRFPIPVLVSIASLLGYNAFLRGFYIYPMHYGTIALLIALTALMAELVYRLFKKRKYSGSLY